MSGGKFFLVWALALTVTCRLFSFPARANEAPPARATLTLEHAIQRALDHNRDLAIQTRDVTQARLNVESARANFGLQLSPDSNAGVSKEGENWQYGLVLSRPTIFGTEVGVGGRYGEDQRITSDDPTVSDAYRSIDVRLTQPLFRNFGTLVNGERILQARQSHRAAMRRYEVARAELALGVVENFESILRLEQQAAYERDAVARADYLAGLTRAREKQGQATELDVLRVDLQKGEAEARLSASLDRLNNDRRALADLLGAPIDLDFELIPAPRLAFDVPTVPDAVQIALSNRLDYAQALDQQRDAGREVEIARRGLWPDINLVARHSWIDYDGAATETDWFVGVTAASRYSVSQQKISLARAKVNLENAGDEVENAARAITREVQQQLVSYQSLRTEMEIESRNFDIAGRRVELARRLFEAGKGDHLSVTDAEDQFAAAAARKFSSASEAAVAGYRLLLTLGTLVDYPAALKPAYTAARRISVYDPDFETISEESPADHLNP